MYRATIRIRRPWSSDVKYDEINQWIDNHHYAAKRGGAMTYLSDKLYHHIVYIYNKELAVIFLLRFNGTSCDEILDYD